MLAEVSKGRGRVGRATLFLFPSLASLTQQKFVPITVSSALACPLCIPRRTLLQVDRPKMAPRVTMEQCLGRLAQAIDNGNDPEEGAKAIQSVKNKMRDQEIASDSQKMADAKNKYLELLAVNTAFKTFDESMDTCLRDPEGYLKALKRMAQDPAIWLPDRVQECVSIVKRANKLAHLAHNLVFPKRTSVCRARLQEAELKLGLAKDVIDYKSLDEDLATHENYATQTPQNSPASSHPHIPAQRSPRGKPVDIIPR